MSETQLILPVAAAEPLVGAWRRRFDPAARAGVAAHITVLGPFIDDRQLSHDDLQALRSLFSQTRALSFTLHEVGRFEHAVYLALRPTETFLALTEAVFRRWPEHPPYRGAPRELVPHLTVASKLTTRSSDGFAKTSSRSSRSRRLRVGRG